MCRHFSTATFPNSKPENQRHKYEWQKHSEYFPCISTSLILGNENEPLWDDNSETFWDDIVKEAALMEK